MRVWGYILSGLLVIATGANTAWALSLDVLDEGGSLESGDLTFTDFDVIATGAVSDDLSLYDVSAIDGGLAITGPIAAADGEVGDLLIQFTVSSSAGAITGAGLTFNGAAAGQTIRFTTDGSMPTASSPAYSAPINVTQTTQI